MPFSSIINQVHICNTAEIAIKHFKNIETILAVVYSDGIITYSIVLEVRLINKKK